MLNRTDRILGPRLVMTGPEDIRFKALAAAIQQRDLCEQLAHNGAWRGLVPDSSCGVHRTFAFPEARQFLEMRFFGLIVHRAGLDRGCCVRTAVAHAGPQMVKPSRARLTIVKRPIRSLEPPWTESDCMALALVACNRCFGLGVRPDGSGEANGGM